MARFSSTMLGALARWPMPDFSKPYGRKMATDINGDVIQKEAKMPEPVMRNIQIVRDMDGSCARDSTVDPAFILSASGKDKQGQPLPAGQTLLTLKNGAFLVVAGHVWEFDPSQTPQAPRRRRGR